MKKLLPITIIALTLAATPAFAANEKANQKAQKTVQTSTQTVETVTPTPTEMLQVTPTISVTMTPAVTITVTPSVSPMTVPSSLKGKKAAGQKALDADKTTPAVTPTCDQEAAYSNHGAYVSCVAHLKVGGQAVSAAARSDIGKKHTVVTVTPSPTEPVTPPVTSAMESINFFNPVKSFGQMFNRFVSFFRGLL